MNAPNPTALLSSFQWILIPHGLAADGANEDKTRPLRATLRAIPKITQDFVSGGNGATRLRNLNRGLDPLGVDAVMDWPAFIGSLQSAVVGFAIPGADRSSPTKCEQPNARSTIRVADAWKESLARFGTTPELASRLWQRMFPSDLPLIAAPSGKKLHSIGASLNQFKVLPSMPHHAATQSLGRIIGQLHTKCLVASTTADLRRQQRFQPPAGVVEVPIRREQESPLDGLRGIISGLGHQTPSAAVQKSTFTLPFERKKQDWLGQLERIAAAGFPFSELGSKALLERVKAWADSSVLDVADDYRLDHLVIDRMFSNASDLAQSPARRPAAKWDQGTSTPPPDPDAPEFHKDVGKLTFHSWLLRVLGLAIDVQIELPQDSKVALFIEQLDCEKACIVPDVETRVVTSMDDDWFPSEDASTGHASSSAQRFYRHGCVRVAAVEPNESQPRFVLEQLDIDSATEKLIGVAQNIQTQFDAGVANRATMLPTFRTGGLSLLMNKQKERYTQSLQRRQAQGDLPSSQLWMDLYAEDLVIGYRPDVQSLAPDNRHGACRGGWKSLVGRRVESFRILGHEHVEAFSNPPQDEGIVTPHARILDPGDQGDYETGLLVLFDELFRWQGWNLTVPTVEALGKGSRDTAHKSTVSYSSAGALPRQRFGWGYRVGLRAVYADGKSIEVDEAASLVYDHPDQQRDQDCTIGTDSVGAAPNSNADYPRAEYYAPFFRYEAIQPPDIKPDSRCGDSHWPTARIDRLVVASDGHGRVLSHDAARWLTQPRVDLDAAIRSGQFDDPATRKHPPRSLQLPDPWATRVVFGVYRSADNQLLRLDYFDYYARDVWPDGRPFKVRLEAVVAEILPANGIDCGWDDDVFVVKLAPGMEVRIRCWHEIDAAKLATSGLVETMAKWLGSLHEASPPSDLQCKDILGVADCTNPEDLRDRLISCLSRWHYRFPYDLRPYLAAGRQARDINLTSFSMLNPAMTLELVHAVPVPARSPRFSEGRLPLDQSGAALKVARLPMTASDIEDSFSVQRETRGETVAEFAGDIEIHRASTRRLDCSARWDEVSDDSGTKPKKMVQRHAMFSVDVSNAALPQPRLSDGQGNVLIDGPAPELPLDNDLVYLRGSRMSIGRTSNLDVDGSSKHFDFGDARARLLEFDLQAVSRFSHDFPSASKFIRPSDVATSRWVKATLPPKKPEVAFIVPLLESEGTTKGNTSRRRRRGGWFRVWLERPWFSSGDGELLAIVCWPGDLFRASGGSGTYLREKARQVFGTIFDLARQPPTAAPPEALNDLYTGWGLDPIWNQGNKPLYFIPPAAFTNRIVPDVTGVVPSQFKDGSITDQSSIDQLIVGLALYKPRYDEIERRWFADIRIEPEDGFYFPFVRLGLARYQPNAIDGCELSEIVSSEFVQLIPERSVTLTVAKARDNLNEVRIRINGFAPSGLADPDYPGVTPQMVVRVDAAKQSRDRDSAPAWIPYLDSTGAEEIELAYDANGHWKGNPQYRFERDLTYSIYIEEREGILVDPADNLDPGAPPVSMRRVVYADRILIRSS